MQKFFADAKIKLLFFFFKLRNIPISTSQENLNTNLTQDQTNKKTLHTYVGKKQ